MLMLSFFNDTATTEIYTLSLHDALPISQLLAAAGLPVPRGEIVRTADEAAAIAARIGYPVVTKPIDGNHGRGVMLDLRSEEHTSELQSHSDLVCRLLLEKKKTTHNSRRT